MRLVRKGKKKKYCGPVTGKIGKIFKTLPSGKKSRYSSLRPRKLQRGVSQIKTKAPDIAQTEQWVG